MGLTLWGEEIKSDIILAAFDGDLLLLESLVQTPEDTHVTDDYGSTPLHQACFHGHLACVMFLVESYANLEALDVNGFTPLQIAAFRGHLDVLEYLVRQRADVNTQDLNGSSALHKCALYNRYDCLCFLLKKAANVNATTSYRKTPLHLAAESGHLNCVQALIEWQADLNAIDKDGNTPLHQAAIQGFTECVQTLVSSGANRSIRNRDGATPLHHATDIGHVECTKILIGAGAGLNSIDVGDASGITPLHQTCYHGYSQCTIELLNAKAQVFVLDDTATSPLHIAAHIGHLECLTQLLDAAERSSALRTLLDHRDRAGATALHKAAYRGHYECASVLLERGAQVDATDDEGATALHKAAFSGKKDCVALLVAHKADSNARDLKGETPLHKAAYNSHEEGLEEMIIAGGRSDEPDANGSTPLHNATYTGSVSCLMKILAHRTNPNCADKRGWTPLHVASMKGLTDVVEYLLSKMTDAGVQVDPVDRKGKTPLWYAIRKKHEDAARALIYEEADVNKEDEKQRSPMALTTLFDCISKDKLLKMIDEGIAYRKRRHLEDPVTKAKITQAVALFNNKPKKGLQFLVDEKVIPDTTTDKAEFLLTNKKLDKVKIGEILGEPDETALLTAFVDLLEFRGMEFDQALRKFLSFFRLPGEAQKIDRMMMAFAQRYHAHNSDSVFASGDAAYVLAFSTIMLNTDAHNPAIRKQNKMTKVQFIGNNRGINEGADLPADFLSALYDRIIEDEIKLDDSNSTYANAEKKGYLTKQGGRIKTWKRRWFVLTNNCLYYFKDKGDKNPQGIIPLESLEIIPIEFGKKGFRKYSFIIQPQGGEGNIKACKLVDGNVVTGNHSRYIVSCETEKERESWITSINTSMKMVPFKHLLDNKSDGQLVDKKPIGE